MKKFLFLLAIFVMLFSACQAAKPLSSNITLLPTPTETSSSASTALPELEVISADNLMRLTQVGLWGDGKIFDVAVSHDKSMIAVSMIKGITLFNSNTLDHIKFIERKVPTYPIDASLPVAFSPDDSYLAISNGFRLSLINLSTYEEDYHLISAIPDFDIQNIVISPDNNHVILTTGGGYMPCDGSGENFALYNLAGFRHELVYDRYFCSPYDSDSVAYFANNGRAYFLYSSMMTSNLYAMDVVDLSTNLVIDRVSFDNRISDGTEPVNNLSDWSQVKAYLQTLKENTNKYLKLFSGFTNLDELPNKNELTLIRNIASNYLPEAITGCRIGLGFLDIPLEVTTNGELSTFIIYSYFQPQAIEIWNTNTCMKEKEIQFLSMESILISPDGKLLAAQNGYNLDVWDVAAGNIRFTATGSQLRFPVNEFIFSADIKLLITGTNGRDYFSPTLPYQDYAIAIWDTQTGEQTQTLQPETESLTHIITGNNPEYVAVSDSTGISLWHVTTGRLLLSIPEGRSKFTNSGDQVWLVPGKDDVPQKLACYDIKSGEILKELITPYNYIKSIFLNPDNSKMGLIIHDEDHNRYLVILDTNTGKELSNTQLDQSIATSESINSIIATYGGRQGYIDFWDFENPTPFLRLYANPLSGHEENDSLILNSGMNALQFFPSGELFISFDTHDSFQFWDAVNGTYLGSISVNFHFSTGENQTVLSPDGKLIAVIDQVGLLHLWGVPSPSE